MGNAISARLVASGLETAGGLVPRTVRIAVKRATEGMVEVPEHVIARNLSSEYRLCTVFDSSHAAVTIWPRPRMG